jgi:hypothetical protein
MVKLTNYILVVVAAISCYYCLIVMLHYYSLSLLGYCLLPWAQMVELMSQLLDLQYISCCFDYWVPSAQMCARVFLTYLQCSHFCD